MTKLQNEIRVPVTATLLGKTIKELQDELAHLNDHDRALFDTLRKTIKAAAKLQGALGIAALTMAFMDLSEEFQ